MRNLSRLISSCVGNDYNVARDYLNCNNIFLNHSILFKIYQYETTKTLSSVAKKKTKIQRYVFKLVYIWEQFEKLRKCCRLSNC